MLEIAGAGAASGRLPVVGVMGSGVHSHESLARPLGQGLARIGGCAPRRPRHRLGGGSGNPLQTALGCARGSAEDADTSRVRGRADRRVGADRRDGPGSLGFRPRVCGTGHAGRGTVLVRRGPGHSGRVSSCRYYSAGLASRALPLTRTDPSWRTRTRAAPRGRGRCRGAALPGATTGPC